jgi:hypothetical protein
MTLDEIYDKLQAEKEKKINEKKKAEQLIIDNYNKYINHLNEDRNRYSYLISGHKEPAGIGVMIMEKTNIVG